MALPEPHPTPSGPEASASSSPTTSLGSGFETIQGVPSPTIPSPATPAEHKCSTCDPILKDLKNPLENPGLPLPGWPEISRLITENPDLEAFQGFRDLHIKSLLYYQAELDGLRKDLHDQEWEDHRYGDFDQAQYLGSIVSKLLDCEYNKEKEDHRQLDLVKKIRRVLKEYSEALLLYKEIVALPQADRLNVSSLRSWLRHSHGDNIPISGPGSESWGTITNKTVDPLHIRWLFLNLLLSTVTAKRVVERSQIEVGSDDKRREPLPLRWQFLDLLLKAISTKAIVGKSYLDDGNSDLDLLTPRYNQRVDWLTQWIANEFVPFWESVRKRHKEKKTEVRSQCLPVTEKRAGPNPEKDNSGGVKQTTRAQKPPTLTEYSENSILRFTSFVATVVACLLPIASIAVLSNMHTTGKLLGLIAGFTTLFALGLMLLTDAATSRVQIFTATAAFSAVLVVFVQNQNQSSNPAN